MVLRWLLLGLAFLLAGCAATAGDEITFSTWGSIDEIDTLKPILADFEQANAPLKVKLIHIPEDYTYKIRLMAASGTLPDVVFISNDALPAFADRGTFRDLGPDLAKGEGLKAEDFFPPVLDAMRWKQTLYGVPRDLSNMVVYYNKALFDAVKQPYPKAGWTMDDMLKAARATTQGEQAFGIGFDTKPVFWLPYLWSFGADVFDAQLARCTLGEPAAIEALSFYSGLRRQHHVAPTEAQTGNARMAQLFATGKIAMYVSGRWSVPGFRKKIKFPWDVAPFPAGPGGSVVSADASGWAISQASQHPEAAWKLVRHLGSRPSIEAFTASGLIVPSRKDVATSKAFFTGGIQDKVFVDAIKTGRPTLSPPSYEEIKNEIMYALEPVWSGQADVRGAVEPLVKRIDALLDEERTK